MIDKLYSNETLKDGKLVIYFWKPVVRLEKTSTLLRPQYKKPIYRMRISAHRLLIELVRYNNKHRTERICKNCRFIIIELEFLYNVVNLQKNTKKQTPLFSEI